MGVADVEDYPRTIASLESRYSQEGDCLDYLFALRWPDGFCCPNCTNGRAWRSSRGLWLCSGCRRQVSVLAGTVFQDTHLPMRTWFRAMWYITSQKNGVSALGLQRVLGLGNYRTAWLMLHKLRQAMVRPGREKLSGVVEVDETYWGSAEFGGATGRKTLSKVLIIVAAEADGKRIGRIRMALIEDFERKPSTASFRIILSWEARFARMVSTPTGNSMAISIIEKFKTFGREASLCFRAFTWSFPC